MDIYDKSKVQMLEKTNKNRTNSTRGAKPKIVLTPNKFKNVSVKSFIEQLEVYLNDHKTTIPQPLEVAAHFNTTQAILMHFVMQNKEVRDAYQMYAERWLSSYYEIAKNEKLTEKHVASLIVQNIFKMADTSKRVPDINITLGKDFFANE